METFYQHASRKSKAGQVDIMEIFGGQGLTTQILVRRYDVEAGHNFDLLTGFDLESKRDVDYLFRYIQEMKPAIVVMAPPCTGLKGFSALNKAINYESWKRSHDRSIRMANLSAAIAKAQSQGGRHFLVEQPEGSMLFQQPAWQALVPYCCAVTFDQCRFGLRMRKAPFLLIRKRTTMWASHPVILQKLEGKLCKNNHEHAIVGGATNGSQQHHVPSVEAQVWPRQLCLALADGIYELLLLYHKHHHTSHVLGKEAVYLESFLNFYEDNELVFYPSAAAGSDDPIAEAESSEDERAKKKKKKKHKKEKKTGCRACDNHMRKDHNGHTRDERCKYREIEGRFSCPGCSAIPEKPFGDKGHTMDPATCRWAAVSCAACTDGLARDSVEPRHTMDVDCRFGIARAEEYGRTRMGHHPRTGRIKAAHDPPSTMKLEDDDIEYLPD